MIQAYTLISSTFFFYTLPLPLVFPKCWGAPKISDSVLILFLSCVLLFFPSFASAFLCLYHELVAVSAAQVKGAGQFQALRIHQLLHSSVVVC